MQRYTLKQLSKYTHAPSDTIYKWIVRNSIPYTLNDYGQVTVKLGDMRDYKPRANRLWYSKLAFRGLDVPTRAKKDNPLNWIQETAYNPLSGLTARTE